MTIDLYVVNVDSNVNWTTSPATDHLCTTPPIIIKDLWTGFQSDHRQKRANYDFLAVSETLTLPPTILLGVALPPLPRWNRSLWFVLPLRLRLHYLCTLMPTVSQRQLRLNRNNNIDYQQYTVQYGTYQQLYGIYRIQCAAGSSSNGNFRL